MRRRELVIFARIEIALWTDRLREQLVRPDRGIHEHGAQPMAFRKPRRVKPAERASDERHRRGLRRHEAFEQRDRFGRPMRQIGTRELVRPAELCHALLYEPGLVRAGRAVEAVDVDDHGLAQEVTGMAYEVTRLPQEVTGLSQEVTGLSQEVFGLLLVTSSSSPLFSSPLQLS